jgi:hypothetical protein
MNFNQFLANPGDEIYCKKGILDLLCFPGRLRGLSTGKYKIKNNCCV